MSFSSSMLEGNFMLGSGTNRKIPRIENSSIQCRYTADVTGIAGNPNGITTIKDKRNAMPHKFWIAQSLIDVQRKDEDKEEESLHKTKSYQYKEEVFENLRKGKENLSLGEDELRKIQLDIEDLTLKFDEESLFRSVPNIIKILIKNDEECAKDILRKRLKTQKDIELISEFGQYTIEALIVHVLSMLFNSVNPETSMIRVSTLIERLENSVRTQAFLLINRRCQKKFTMSTETTDNENGKKRSKLEKMYPIGSGLVEFMDERGLITLMNDKSGNVRVMNKKGAYFIPNHLYAVCNFDISLLPIKLNLPMVCKPLDWTSACPEGQEPRTLSDLSGGYLSCPTGDIYDRYRLLSTGSLHHYFIDIGRGKGDYLKLCDIMNKLQNQAFQINSDWLQYIENNEKLLVDYGYLKPRFLVSLNLKKASDLLREFHMKDKDINKLCSFSELLQTLNKNIQCSRYEDLIIKLAKAYDGYHFYLPAFLDFRGRIYRSGILHFHERDLARSLILFAGTKFEKPLSNIYNNIIDATAFHYKKFTTVNDAKYWFLNNIDKIKRNPIDFAREAKHPFQFLANVIGLSNEKTEVLMNTPITQDASASAYQIMSYFLMDEILAKRTNLIPSEDGQIQDLYSFLLKELIEFMKAELDNKSLSNTVCQILNRNIVKKIFMPIIYGKTVMSTTMDLKEHLSHYITYKDCCVVAKACFKFWNQRCPGMSCLIRLIRHIGWIVSAGDRPVFYKVPFFTT
ncbi:uncharacterized protein LOC109828426, partial [Asparagus officinalis]|uniref:uncharacterized protein LOC109828426 n=1 Tax=Asparagus officinalis TaxID=4686 RepID=UPI00098E32A8